MNKLQRPLIIALTAGIVICMGITIWALFFRGGSPDNGPISPDYPPQGTEDNQTPINGDDSTKIDSPEGGGAIRVTYATAATANLSTGKVSLHYENPRASNQNVQVFIIITNQETGDEIVVAKSDLINPGNEVNTLTFEKYAQERLGAGGYNAVLVIKSFDPTSGEKAMIDTKGEITLTVVK